MAQRAAAVAVVSYTQRYKLTRLWRLFLTQDFTRIYSSLGLGKSSISSLQAFRKRHSEAQRISNSISGQPTTVDFSHYRAVLKNQAIVDEAEKILNNLKPRTYDVNVHIKAIETFEAKAVGLQFYPLWNIFECFDFIGGWCSKDGTENRWRTWEAPTDAG